MPSIDEKVQAAVANLLGQQTLQLVTLREQLAAVTAERDALLAKHEPPAKSLADRDL